MNYGIDIENLIKERFKLLKAIHAMDTVLLNLGVDVAQLDGDNYGARVSLASEMRKFAIERKDGITKEAMVEALAGAFPFLKFNSQSVAAGLVKMSQGDDPILFVNKRGAGNQPTVYTTEAPKVVTLTPPQIAALFAPERTTGSGGMQNLYKRIRKEADRKTGRVALSPNLQAAIHHYYFHYGTGGWQHTMKQIFGEHVPELFVKSSASEG